MKKKRDNRAGYRSSQNSVSTMEQLDARRLLSATLLADLAPGPNSSVPFEFVEFGGEAYFTLADKAATGVTSIRALWKTNGTAAGTVMVSGGSTMPIGLDYTGVVSFWPYGANGVQDLTVIGDKLWALEFEHTTVHMINVYLRSFSQDGSTTKSRINQLNLSWNNDEISTITVVDDHPYIYLGHVGDKYHPARWYSADDDGQVSALEDQGAGPSSYTTYVHVSTVDSTLRFAPGNGSDSVTIGGNRLFAQTDAEHGNELWIDDGIPNVPERPPVKPKPPTAAPAVASINGVLTIRGTAMNDDIVVSRSPSMPDRLVVSVDGARYTFSSTEITRVQASLDMGDDSFVMKNEHGDIRFATRVNAGAGDDTIYTASGRDTIYGEAGDDELHGGDDRDQLFGGDGIDKLEGGAGMDKLWGNAGDDTFIHVSKSYRLTECLD